MFTKLVLILSLLTTSAYAANVPQAASVAGLCNTVGSVNSISSPSINTPLQSLSALGYKVLLISFGASPTADHYFSFKDLASMTGAAYNIPVGNKFYVACMSSVVASATPVPYQLVTGTSAFNADNDNVAPAGAKYSGGASSAYGFLSGISASTYANPVQYNYPIIFDATAATLYLGIQVGTGGAVGGIIMVGKVAP